MVIFSLIQQLFWRKWKVDIASMLNDICRLHQEYVRNIDYLVAQWCVFLQTHHQGLGQLKMLKYCTTAEKILICPSVQLLKCFKCFSWPQQLRLLRSKYMRGKVIVPTTCRYNLSFAAIIPHDPFFVLSLLWKCLVHCPEILSWRLAHLYTASTCFDFRYFFLIKNLKILDTQWRPIKMTIFH